MSGRATSGRLRSRVRLNRSGVVGLLLFLCILSGYLLSFNVDKPTHNADWYIRYQVTCSIVEHNAFYIYPYRADGRTGPGIHGHFYSQYTLGQTTAMIPLYLLGRVLAGLRHTNCARVIAPPIVLLTCKMLDLILGALIGLLFFAMARLLRYERLPALVLTMILAFGSSLWPDVLSNLEHTMESLFLLSATYAALRYTLQRRQTWLWVLAMGVAAGLVFVTRVSGIIVPPIFALYLVALHRRQRPGAWKRPLLRDGAIFAAGVLPSLVINAVFDALRFGSPLRTGPYPDQSLGYPPWLGIPNLLASPGKGLLWYTPAVLLLLPAARAFWRRYPLPAILFALIAGIYLVFYANVQYWHGDPAWGPRYLYATLPYLILPLGEVLRRWRDYRLPMRAFIVGALASSFLVQFSAVTVSYWRHGPYIYGYHYEQVENHSWGQNLNYWWYPDQSPIVISLAGLSDITQKYVDHAPLLAHAPSQRLSNPRETCTFQVYGQASICLTDIDDLHDAYTWNTFTPWWTHVFPWWDQATVTRLAALLLVVFLASGGALVAQLTAASRQEWRGRLFSTTAQRQGMGDNRSDGHADHDPLDATTLPSFNLQRLDVVRAYLPPQEDEGSVAVAAPAPPPVVVRAAPTPARPASGFVPLGLAVLFATLVYGGIAGVAALRAPRHAPPLIHVVAAGMTVHDGDWAYRVLRVTNLAALPGGIAAPPPGYHFTIVRLRVRNYAARPRGLGPASFSLTDRAGRAYPPLLSALTPVAQLYHLAPFGAVTPARSAVDGVQIFLVRDGARNLELLGPGIALAPLA